MMKILTSNPFSLEAAIPACKALLIAAIPLKDLQEMLKLAIVLMTGLLKRRLISSSKHFLTFSSWIPISSILSSYLNL